MPGLVFLAKASERLRFERFRYKHRKQNFRYTRKDMKPIVWAVLSIALSLVVSRQAIASPSATSAPEPFSPAIRVMELGDSITAGVVRGAPSAAHGGYRQPLASLLQAHDYHIAFVGSRTDYSTGMAAPNHEGWPGYVIRSYASAPTGQIYGAVASKALRTYRPDVVLLMIGTNDLLRVEKHDAGYTQAGVAHNMDLLLRQIFTIEPNVRLLVAGVVNSPRLSPASVDRYDRVTLPALVAAYQRRGYRISLVGAMETAVPRDHAHFPDGIHPYGANGYGLVADTWFAAIQTAIAGR